MLSLPPSVRIWLAAEPTDMRKGFDALVAIVRSKWEVDPFSGHLFVFLSRRRDRIKAIWWDRGGFAMLYKRLERGRFQRPVMRAGQSTIELEAGELAALLDGLDLRQLRRPVRWRPPAWVSSRRDSA